MTPEEQAVAQKQALQGVREEFLRREVTVTGTNGETAFTIGKMPATKGWDTLESIREAVREPLESMHDIKAIVTALPKLFARALRDTMFEHVTFRNRIAGTPLVLAGNEETAFDAIDAEPVAIYEMFLRSLCVNFTPSFEEIFERISSLQSSIGRPSNTGISLVSSPPA